MYFLPYFFIAFILCVLYVMEQRAIRAKDTPTPFRVISLLIMIVFMGLRGFIFSDFIIYYADYTHYPTLQELSPVFMAKERYEEGFIVYMCLFRTLGIDYFTWVFISTLIDIIVLYMTFKRYCRSAILPFVFFMAFNGLIMEFNLMRNMKALDLFLISLPYLEKKKILPYILLNLAGSLFHTSALLYIPCYFLLTRKIPKWVLWTGVVVVNVIYIFNVPIFGNIMNHPMFKNSTFGETYMHYLEDDREEIKFTVHYFERIISIIIFILLYKRMSMQQKSNLIFLNALWIYYVSFTLCYEYVVLSERIPFLFVFGYWVLYPNLLGLKYKFRKYVNIGIWLLLTLKMYSSFNQKAAIYSNIIFGIPNYTTERSRAMKEISN